MKIRFDRGPDRVPQTFEHPKAIICAHTLAEVDQALSEIDAARAAGDWVAGYATYELGYALDPVLAHLMPENLSAPLLRFGVYDRPTKAEDLPLGRAIDPLTPDWSEAEYTKQFNKLRDYIGAGDVYQVNLTFGLGGQVAGSVEAIYAHLLQAQPVAYGALITEDGQPAILSRSPELFFRTNQQGLIETRPMKGTQPRHKDPIQDAAARAFLAADEKNRAENLMIVDLLRNDISRICEIGSVKVPELFAVETYATVHQMVSHVVGQMRPEVRLSDIFRALFPCGSITGAPKVRAMQIIRELETAPRGVYCGAIGWAAPNGRSEFNVAIRTPTIHNRHITANVGGGIVWDSRADSEYQEALWKTRYLYHYLLTAA